MCDGANMNNNMKILLTEDDMRKAIDRIAEGIISSFSDGELRNSAFMGIQLKGVPLALRITERIKNQTGIAVPNGVLDITMYRDDFGLRKKLPSIRPTEVPFDLDGKIIVLVDDVLHTGRTIRAALDALTDYGRPDLIRLACLVDRGNQEFPIKSDFTGEMLSVEPNCKIVVYWNETDDQDGVFRLPDQTEKGI